MQPGGLGLRISGEFSNAGMEEVMMSPGLQS